MDHFQAGLDKWDLRFLKLADHIAQWSKDPTTRVGAVIVDRKRRVLGMGYNGFPRGVSDDAGRYQDRKTKLQLTTHAESNAILNAMSISDVEGATLYVNPLFPCPQCAGAVIQAGISRVVAVEKPTSNIEWASASTMASTMFAEAGVFQLLVTPEVLEEEYRD